MNNIPADMDYQETIRAAAQAFIERHQGEHLGDLGQLLSRTADHLVESFEVKESFANHLVHQAYSNVLAVIGRQRIDLQASAEMTVVISDPIRGLAWSVPVHLIYEHLIAAGHGKPFFPAT
ncbi:hypothetical protein QCD83_26795 [Pseudomonas savastanoi pv. phaseolicola]|uniref:Uncharacterized protein n=1 Tax=Pseudomonas savastanoi pv. glycinea TaxID=318 RepID=A0A3M3FZH2_PSESG|nr:MULTISPECIES: hypothetical protein [Pseudomonas syringae group genomosp. 2]MBI6732282.1 hypothetical protein [Pseudomonas amygdali]MBI6812731.1 hypothetical protein [Pseudomonas amygdali]MDG6382400.1 hypothetical protein [Pseudomonas savastanoi pv. phaseolicola]RMM67335.1 hypothetical protein ALQ74_02178 [Pseudomonas savastanoi pv. glycinea]RMO94430.1 hypothetical protein ALQ31_01692 [Pseudomonas amygdali pv. morsprunorum]